MFGYSSRRHFRENEVIRKRVSEEERIKKWSDVKDYYKTCDHSSSKLTHWASSQNSSSRSVTPEMSEIEEKKKNLDVRRQQLKNLLDSEMEIFQKEQKEYSIVDLKPTVNIEMKRKEEEPAVREAELMLYHSNSFMTPNQYNRQYRHLSRKAAKDDLKLLEDTSDSKAQPSSGFPDSENQLKVRLLEAQIADIDSKIDKLFELIRLNDEEQRKLKELEVEKSRKALEVDNMFQELSISETSAPVPDTTRYEQWKHKCLCVQNDLKKALHFVQQMRECVSDCEMDDGFLSILLHHNTSLEESLKFESSGDRLIHLLERTRREPNKKWFQEEMTRWQDQATLRQKTQKEIYDAFRSLVQSWTSKNLDKVSELVENENKLLGQLQIMKNAKETAQNQLKPDR
ncbi:interaptin [Nilaparvata lugens]|uniref:interaptin n=1 Tax=Nilaparvata lugens TaxID=108931 RepID=UPI00193DA3C4|nr:interaptin [Nilaparvata lugens]